MESATPRRRLGRPPTEQLAEGERRAQILHTAMDLFGRRGYAAVSVGEIADHVGVTKAAIYHHFPSKDILFTAVLCFVLQQIAGSIRLIAQKPQPLQQRIYEIAAQAIIGVQPDFDLDSLMRDVEAQLSPAERDEVATAHRGVIREIEALASEGIASGVFKPFDPLFLAYALFHLIGSFTGRTGLENGFQGQIQTVNEVVNLFLHGVVQSVPDPPQS